MHFTEAEGLSYLVVALAITIVYAPTELWPGTGHRLANLKVLRNGIALGNILTGRGRSHIGAAFELGEHCACGHTID